ncbi:hypothetical protein BGZ83_011092 [Gryganskiella cystojenkinii]|nr:hypothetical protein BGZ83_011092 [Gryganskiella cystojenkinii]
MVDAKKPAGFRLRISAGPNTDHLTVVSANDDANPLKIESDEFVGQIVVRIKGLDKKNGYEAGQKVDHQKVLPDSAWFTKPGGDNNLSSVQISGRFKREWAGDQVVFGNQFEKPLRLPPFSGIALRFIQFIDPGLKADIYSERPWAFSPLIATMNTVNVSGWHIDKATQDKVERTGEEEDKVRLEQELPPWPSPEGEHIVEDTTLLFKKDDPKKKEEIKEDASDSSSSSSSSSSTAETNSEQETKKETPAQPLAKALSVSARRSFFSKEKNLKQHRYRPDQVYGFDFFNPYLDIANFTLNVPGFSVDITRYWDGQPLTYIIKSQDSSVVFMVFQFELLPVEEITVE